MKRYEIKVCMGILVLLFFLAGHLTIYTWDGGIALFGVYFYSAVFIGDTLIVIGFILQFIVILLIIRDEVSEKKER